MIHSCSYYCDRPECIKAQRDELRSRLAQPEQEPVAWLYLDSWGTMKLSQVTPPPVGAFPVYTAPPQRAWIGLTDEEVVEVLGNLRESITGNVFLAFARAIEAKLKERNT